MRLSVSHLPQLDGNITVESNSIPGEKEILSGFQLDGNISGSTCNNSSESAETTLDTSGSSYATEDEVEPQLLPANLSRVEPSDLDEPVLLEVKKSSKVQNATSLPLISVMNARSLYQKKDNFKTFLKELGIEIAIVSETWERENETLGALLQMENHKVISYKRPKVKANKQPGGGCAIIYCENRFKVSKLPVHVPSGVESVWSLVEPNQANGRISKIAICSLYVSPTSKFKTKTIDHIVETIHLLRSQYGNEISFLMAGDFNQLNINRILECYGSLKQIISDGTRNSAILEYIITDLQGYFHPPASIKPLEVDENKIGKHSDHNIVVLAPINLPFHGPARKKRVIKTRPLPQSQIEKFGKFITAHEWSEVFSTEDVNEKVENFHYTLMNNLNLYFPEKCMKVSSLDKKFMTPELKQLQRQTQREFYKKRKSLKWKKLKRKFKTLKKKTIRKFYKSFVTELKTVNPSKWYAMAKKIGAVNQSDHDDLQVEALAGLTDQESSEQIARHFAAISQEYLPLNTCDLPAFLPALPPPKVTELQVFERLSKMKKTKSTQPIDIPYQLRKEFAPELAAPVANIFNSSLDQHIFPTMWKQEWVTPVPKISSPKTLADLRKISSTSEFSKCFEGFLKDWIMEDISPNLDPSQYGNQEGTGTDHMLVALLDKILLMLDESDGHAAVITSMIDWSSAFDRQDPTLAIHKFYKMGLRSSLIPILVSYLQERKMTVKVKGSNSSVYSLPGGGPQGSLIGGIEYLVNSNDNADFVDEDEKFKYVDDLSVLEFVCLAGLLCEYNFRLHVASDIAIDSYYLPPNNFNTQDNLNKISEWTNDNLMVLNEKKSKYMIFNRAQADFNTRLTLNGRTIDQVQEVRLLGVLLSDDLKFDSNTHDICRRAFARISMITKLKYVGVEEADLVEIYTLFVRSLLEYCCVAWHSSITQAQSYDIERVQRTALKVILGQSYTDYASALKRVGLDTLFDRREKRCLSFGLKCIKHPKHKRMFPLGETSEDVNLRVRNKFKVNFARKSTYQKSAIPYIQNMLNVHSKKE